MIELTDQQRLELKNNGEPARLVDPATNREYVLLPLEEYLKLSGQSAEGSRSPSQVRLSNDTLRELAKTHTPPQSWYDEKMEGLY